MSYTSLIIIFEYLSLPISLICIVVDIDSFTSTLFQTNCHQLAPCTTTTTTNNHDNISSSASSSSSSSCLIVKVPFIIYYTANKNSYFRPNQNEINESILHIIHNELSHIETELKTDDNIKSIQFYTPPGTTTSTKDKGENIPGIIIEDEDEDSSLTLILSVSIVSAGLISIALLIMIKGGRSKRFHHHNNMYHDTNTSFDQTNHIIPYVDRHNMIRSDDSISDSPMSSVLYEMGLNDHNNGHGNGMITPSNRRRRQNRGMIDNGSDISGSSASASMSDSTYSSRPSFNVQLEEASHCSQGIEASKQEFYTSPTQATYLPSSVLKDLLDGSGRTKSFGVLDAVDL